MPATDGAWRSRSEGAGGTVVRGERWAFGIQSPRLPHVHMPFIRPFAGGRVGAEDLYLVVPCGLTFPSERFRRPRKGRALRALLPPILHAPRRAAASAWSTTVSSSGCAQPARSAMSRPHHAIRHMLPRAASTQFLTLLCDANIRFFFRRDRIYWLAGVSERY